MPNITPREKRENLRSFLLHNKQSIADSLPKFLSPERLIGQLFTSISTTPRLLEATPRSLIGALLYCGSLGLEPGPLGHIYLIPFNNRKKGIVEVQVIPGYKGLVQLARRSEQIAQIGTGVIWEGDTYEFDTGTNAFVTHQPNKERSDFGDFTQIEWVYAWYKLRDVPGIQLEIMSRNKVEYHRKRYSKAAQDGPWVTAWDEMAVKTALRKLLKLAPMATDVQSAIVIDEMAESQLSQQGLLPDMPEEIEGQLAESEEAPAKEQDVICVPQWAHNTIKGKPLDECSVQQLRGLAKTLEKRTEGPADQNPAREQDIALLATVKAMMGTDEAAPQSREGATETPKAAEPAPPNQPAQKQPPGPEPDAQVDPRQKMLALVGILEKMPGGKYEILNLMDYFRVEKIADIYEANTDAAITMLMERISYINRGLQHEKETAQAST